MPNYYKLQNLKTYIKTNLQNTCFKKIKLYLSLFYLCFCFSSHLNICKKNNFSLEPIPETGNNDFKLKFPQDKLDFMARFKEIESFNPKLRQDQIAKDLGCSSSTLRRYGRDINMFSPNRIPPYSHKRKQNTSNTNLNDDSHCEYELKGLQKTSNYLKMGSKALITNERSKLKDGSSSHGSILNKKTFSSPINGGIYRKKKKIRNDKTNYHKPLEILTKKHMQQNQK